MTDRKWRDVSEQEIRKNQRNLCVRCIYSLGIEAGKNSTYLMCDYLTVKKEKRGCSPFGCTKFEERKKRWGK